ncbi:MAG: metallophosphoesterase [Halobacteriaceae archaeon]
MLVLGDAHASDPSNREALLDAYRETDPEAALQAGDLEYYRLPAPTYFVAGNNEDLDVIEALRHGRVESSAVHNVHLLDSTLAEVQGLRVSGLSGNYAPSRYHLPREALAQDRRRHFTHEDVERAMQLEDADVDVFITHEAPHGTPIEEEYDVGCKHVDRLLEVLEPDLCLVGHHHQHTVSEFGPTKVVSLAPVPESYYTLDPETRSLTRHDR